ncbi:hypothetical protein V6Z11_A11G326200 [Gossypium hirsutum]
MRIQYGKTKSDCIAKNDGNFVPRKRRSKKKKVVILWYLRFSAKRDFAVFTTVREADIINDNSYKVNTLYWIDTGGCITNNVDTVVTANQPTQIDHARCDNEVNPESSVQAAYCEGTKGGGNDFVKCCYNKRRRISVNRR